jgi:plastocyanin
MPVLRRLAIGAVALAVTAALGACTQNDNGNNTLVGRNNTPTPTGGGPQTTGAANPGTGGSIAVEAKDNAFAPKSLTAKAGDITIDVKDTGQAPHTFTISELSADSGNINAGASATVTLKGVQAGTYKFFCKYHEALGMTGTLTVA